MNGSYPFRISGLSATIIDEFRGLPAEELSKRGVVRYVANAKPGFPCRVTLADAEVGESVLLLNFEHLPGHSPYRSVGPIFVRESATETYSAENEVPAVLPDRLLSVRAYDQADMLVEAEVIPGRELEPLIQRFFTNNRVSYLHIHNARPGCYSCRVDRI